MSDTPADETADVPAPAVGVAAAEVASVSASSNSPPEGEKPAASLSYQSQDGSTGRRKRRSRSLASRSSHARGVQAWAKLKIICDPSLRVLQWLVEYVKAMFTLPLVEDPVAFCRPEDFTNKGERVIAETAFVDDEDTMDMLEAACNYSEETRDQFVKLIAVRKQVARNIDHPSHDLDFGKLAPWNEGLLNSLKSTFQVFDISGDGAVDFDEMSALMIEFGDKSTHEDREKLFSIADPKGKGVLNFNEFVTMIHLVTVKAPDQFPTTICDTFRLIDRNMTRIRNLDVVQQLQAGLFWIWADRYIKAFIYFKFQASRFCLTKS